MPSTRNLNKVLTGIILVFCVWGIVGLAGWYRDYREDQRWEPVGSEAIAAVRAYEAQTREFARSNAVTTVRPNDPKASRVAELGGVWSPVSGLRLKAAPVVFDEGGGRRTDLERSAGWPVEGEGEYAVVLVPAGPTGVLCETYVKKEGSERGMSVGTHRVNVTNARLVDLREHRVIELGEFTEPCMETSPTIGQQYKSWISQWLAAG